MKKSITGICIITILLFNSCDKEDDLYFVGNNKGPELSQIISFYKLSAGVLDADSATLCTITIKINPETDPTNRNIVFRASGGSFANKDTLQILQANSEGYTTAALLCDSPQTVRIMASVLTYNIDTVIKFIAALPDDVLLSADSYTGDTSQAFHLTSKLFRNPGRGLVSDPVKVFYQIVPLDTSLNLVYPTFTNSINHEAVIAVTNPFKISGRFEINSRVLSAAGDTLSKKLMIIIK